MAKIAIVTGASRGLGRNTALSIARRGGDVILTYQQRSEEAESAVAEIKAMGRKAVAFQLDAGKIADFKPFAERLRKALQQTWQRDTFDHLVNNAGHGDYALIESTTEAQFDGLINVHFKGVYFLTQTLLPLIAGVPAQLADHFARNADAVGIILGQILAGACHGRVHVGTAQILVIGDFAGGGFEQRRARQEHLGPLAHHDHVIRQPRHVGPAGGG